MNIAPDPAFRTQLLTKMVEREFSPRSTTHCSDLIYCLNKSAFRRVQPKRVSDAVVIREGVGWATQRWLTGADRETEYSLDGITVTPDATYEGIPWELKSTATSSSRTIIEESAWVRQIMAQCKVTGSLTARLTRLELLGDYKWLFGKKEEKEKSEHPTLSAYLFTFTPSEIEANWQWLVGRKTLFENILLTGTFLPPAAVLPPQQNWECKYCEYTKECADEQCKLKSLKMLALPSPSNHPCDP